MKYWIALGLILLTMLGFVAYNRLSPHPQDALPATANTTTTDTSSYPAGREPMALPADYRETLIHYATVDRIDGITRHIYISPEAITALRNGQPFPERTVIVIEAYDARLGADGRLLLDQDGYLIPDMLDPEIHMAENRSTWWIEDLAASSHLGGWNFGAFMLDDGRPVTDERATCFSCHEGARRRNFVFTSASLQRYAETGEVQYEWCNLPDRVPCR